MAIVADPLASVQVWDSANHKGSATFHITEADAKAYVAAANQAARDATNTGLLLVAALDLTAAHATTHYRKWDIDSQYVNDAATATPPENMEYNTNRLKVTYSTTNAGIPAIESLYIPDRRDDLTMESDGIHVNLVDGGPVEDFCTQLIAHGRSSFLTPITDVLSITVNDS